MEQIGLMSYRFRSFRTIRLRQPRIRGGTLHKWTVEFADVDAANASVVGGKGINLAALSRATFQVPPGYIITTHAYGEFIAANGLSPKIAGLLESIDLSDADQLEEVTSNIRELVTLSAMPPNIADDILKAYTSLGDATFVAVRSSGTAEDLAGASFAGQHDTYLDIRGNEALFDAVKRCWASLWTARAVAYRQRSGFAHASVGIAVVIQTMIESEVAGVMFTVNPMTGAVDEFVVNASWGLGEAIVAGVVNPDLFVLNRDDGSLRRETVGSKTIKIVRDRARGGTRREEVSQQERERPCLSREELSELAALGSRVMEYCEGYPQDIEWALAGGQFYLLQSRDVTGAELSWDEDLDNWQKIPKVDSTTWTRAWSDEVWTGAITPLMYSFRAENSQLNKVHFSKIWGINWGWDKRVYKYHKGFVYYNCEIDYDYLKETIHPTMRRDELFGHLPPAWRKDILQEPFSWQKFLSIWVRIGMLDRGLLPWNCWDYNYGIIERNAESAHGLPVPQIRRLTDRALKKYTTERMYAEPEYFKAVLPVHYLLLPIAMGYLHLIVEKWYGDSDPSTPAVLMTGSPYQSITIKENLRLQELAATISASPLLNQLFGSFPGAQFFAEARKHAEAAPFLESYDRFIDEYGFRGHADRDIWFSRRSEDPGITYAALKPLVGQDLSVNAKLAEGAVAKRLALTEKVIAKLKTLPFGEFRAQAFTLLQGWLLRFWTHRDDERGHADKITFSIKKAVQEIGRRLVDRGILEKVDDIYFYSRDELFELLDGGKSSRLSRAKLLARRRNHTRFRKEFVAPMYMVGDRYADLESPQDNVGDANVLRGIGTSGGKYTGQARVIESQRDIGKVKSGEILVTTATDPGWTPVFMVISGLVLETGGMLAHGSVISREYGIPAVQIANAMKRIRDGARITVNGDMGEVQIEQEASVAAQG
jgi:pyruvate,water dikinase